MVATTARQRAIANENRQIDESRDRAIAAREAEQRKPRNALEAMAGRLNVSAGSLKNTLLSTVFKECRNDEEFVALCLVANEYKLNPLLKEIYAFPAKGGGITPMVSVDGWIRMMNEHPEFDGIEFDYHADANGEIEAIESIIFRKDRAHPVKTIEYLDECKGNTGPWNKSPLRMLRHRALIQGARIAFGFSGINADIEDSDFQNVTVLDATPKTLPSAKSLAEELDDGIPDFDKRGEHVDEETGEVLDHDSRGMTEVDEDTARQLDAGDDANDGTFDEEENPTAEEGPTQEQRRAEPAEEEEPAWVKVVRGTRGSIASAKTVQAIDAIERDWLNKVRPGVPDQAAIREVEQQITAKKKAFKAKAEG
ncbi:RecT family recombinase [Novosphingobium sp. KN65.2]|uniref:RecT family recombinase n=1 Tax=Novosphingobium sp. KN65.2 TaxID=1478134 RepID=UPI0005DD9D3B|nr:RecT family recombinase [Novosphingobium sp. KN65.2]CDO37624.1 Recombination protein bet (modular protein) [Novosphingobium sp. KN65.2]